MELSESHQSPVRKHVVVAILVREQVHGFEVLLCRRKSGDRYALLWEFPGGKVEAHETPLQALERECREEIAIQIKDAHLLHNELADYSDGGSFLVEYYAVFEWRGEPENVIFETIKWTNLRQLLHHTMHSANIPVCENLPKLLPQVLQSKRDEYWMGIAIEQAQQAARKGEVPIGCVIVKDNQQIALGENTLEADQDPTAHAEILAIRKAAMTLGSRRLLDCTLYVTLEPCPMCAGAIVNARIPRIVYAAADPKAGACDTLYSITDDMRLNHRCEVLSGLRSAESSALLKDFFATLRNRNQTR